MRSVHYSITIQSSCSLEVLPVRVLDDGAGNVLRVVKPTLLGPCFSGAGLESVPLEELAIDSLLAVCRVPFAWSHWFEQSILAVGD